ncbi:MAG: GntP family permease [Bacteroidota bacterium]
MQTVFLLLLSVIFIVLSTTRLKLHPLLALVFAALIFGLGTGMAFDTLITAINTGFGSTIGKIGLVILAGSIIGAFLEKSGGVFRIAEWLLNAIGKARVPAAMSIIGYIVSIPVFADSSFIILAPLNRALSKRAGLSLACTVVALALGLTVSHNLVPPTPGPIAAAGILGADLGMVILMGIPISLVVLVVAWLFAAKWANRIQIDPNPALSEADIQQTIQAAPSVGKSILPILIPLILIVFKTIAGLKSMPLGEGILVEGLSFVGEPVIALLIGVLLAFLLPQKLEKDMLSPKGWVGKAVIDAAVIIAITGAGGAFGKTLQSSDLVDLIGDSVKTANLGIFLPFILAAALKSAQGSSTVALITTASILAPMAAGLGFESEMSQALLVLAIGAGSMVVSHANDSFFWVVTQMSDFDVRMGYRLISAGTGVLGTSAILVIWLVSLFV